MSDSDDEPITLSSTALDALKDFYSERDAHAEKFERLKTEATEVEDETQGAVAPLSMDAFTEDWQESQFWYSDATATHIAKELLNGATKDTVIAAVSAPSVFVALKNLINAAGFNEPKPKLYLLEHDRRFAIFPEFIFYDLNQPTKLPDHLKGNVDRAAIDPPFLNTDCQTKMALSVRWMIKPQPVGPDTASTKVIICTGERMEELVIKLYRSFGVRTTMYEVVHAHGLSNEFLCYANCEGEAWRFKPEGGSG